MTIVGWGSQIYVLEKAVRMAEEQLGASCELIDLRTINPWDVETIEKVRLAPTPRPWPARLFLITRPLPRTGPRRSRTHAPTHPVGEQDRSTDCEPRGTCDGRLCRRDREHDPGALVRRAHAPVAVLVARPWGSLMFLRGDRCGARAPRRQLPAARGADPAGLRLGHAVPAHLRAVLRSGQAAKL